MTAPLREAASVIVLRRTDDGGVEVFMLRRTKGAAWASAFVFPGGATEEGEDARTAAARELFEEAGVLLAKDSREADAETLEMPSVATLRKRILGGASAAQAMRTAGLAWSTDVLVPWSHWITPSIEPKRFSARFFVCELPSGQEPSFDAVETVEQLWVRPLDAIARAGELALPPPQIRTLWELAQGGSLSQILAAGHARAEEPHPILPRLRDGGGAPTLLLPWDPEYVERGTGDAAPLNYQPRWATGPSRFVREGSTWKHVHASTSAG